MAGFECGALVTNFEETFYDIIEELVAYKVKQVSCQCQEVAVSVIRNNRRLHHADFIAYIPSYIRRTSVPQDAPANVMTFTTVL